jgi:hypothetical protein
MSLLRCLAIYYIQSLDRYTRLSLGLVNSSKRSFFENFYPAFDKSFIEANIAVDDLEDPQASIPYTNHSIGCLDSLLTMRTIGRIVNEGITRKDV